MPPETLGGPLWFLKEPPWRPTVACRRGLFVPPRGCSLGGWYRQSLEAETRVKELFTCTINIYFILCTHAAPALLYLSILYTFSCTQKRAMLGSVYSEYCQLYCVLWNCVLKNEFSYVRCALSFVRSRSHCVHWTLSTVPLTYWINNLIDVYLSIHGNAWKSWHSMIDKLFGLNEYWLWHALFPNIKIRRDFQFHYIKKIYKPFSKTGKRGSITCYFNAT